MAVHEVLESWIAEPVAVDERSYTSWAEPGWRSWNGYAAEREFCELAAALARMVGGGDKRVVETGVGGGFTTRRIAEALALSGSGERGRLLCFESDAELRLALQEIHFFRNNLHVQLSEAVGPAPEEMAEADLTVLDSDLIVRSGEILMWAQEAHPGALLLVHDCGNGHGEGSVWMNLRKLITDLEIRGTFMHNPRGSFLGIR